MACRLSLTVLSLTHGGHHLLCLIWYLILCTIVFSACDINSLTNRCRSSFAPSLWNLHLENTLPSLKFEVCWYAGFVLIILSIQSNFFSTCKNWVDFMANWSRESWSRGKLTSWQLIWWQLISWEFDLLRANWMPKCEQSRFLWLGNHCDQRNKTYND